MSALLIRDQQDQCARCATPDGLGDRNNYAELLIYYADASYISKTSLTFCYCPGTGFRPSGLCAFILFRLWPMGLSTQLFCLPLVILLFHWPLKGRSIVISLPPERSEAPLVYLSLIGNEI